MSKYIEIDDGSLICSKCGKEYDIGCMNSRCTECDHFHTKEELKQKIFDAVHFRGHFTLTFISMPDPQINDPNIEFKGESEQGVTNIEYFLDPNTTPVKAKALNMRWYAPMDFEWLMRGIIKDSEQDQVLQNYIKAFEQKDNPEIRIRFEEEKLVG